MPTDVAERLAADIAAEHYGRRQILARRTSQRMRDLWSSVRPEAIGETWAPLLPLAVRELTIAQAEAAAMTEPYLAAAIEATTFGQIRPAAFAGVASDGRNLAGLLYSPAVRSFVEIAQGRTATWALDVASRQLGMIAGTQVQDAGRVADGAGITARDGVGYVRQLRTPSCSRCIVLADRFYRWNAGFQRHPRCDCQHIPTTAREGKDRALDTDSYFRSLSAKDQDRVFTIAGAQAIRDGADIGQVVNARRGMTTAGTLEGTTKRGFAGQRAAALGAEFGWKTTISRYSRTGLRLMPEQIYAMSTSRADAVTALRAAGFIV